MSSCVSSIGSNAPAVSTAYAAAASRVAIAVAAVGGASGTRHRNTRTHVDAH